MRPGDGGDDPAAETGQVRNGGPRAATVVDVDEVHGGAAQRASADHDRDAPFGQARGEGIVAVERDQEDAVDVAARSGSPRRGPRPDLAPA